MTVVLNLVALPIGTGGVVHKHNIVVLKIPTDKLLVETLRCVGLRLYTFATCSLWCPSELDSKRGLLDINNFEYETLLGTEFGMSKKERIMTFDSGSSHAMTLKAVDLDKDGKPIKWQVENSWGASSGHQGTIIMTDEWFDEYMFRLVVDKKYVPAKVLDVLKQKPTKLPAWDPMFTPEE